MGGWRDGQIVQRCYGAGWVGGGARADGSRWSMRVGRHGHHVHQSSRKVCDGRS